MKKQITITIHPAAITAVDYLINMTESETGEKLDRSGIINLCIMNHFTSPQSFKESLLKYKTSIAKFEYQYAKSNEK